MDNVIWLIIVAAVVIAIAGMVLFIASEGVGDVGDRVNDFMTLDEDPEDAQDDLNTGFRPMLETSDTFGGGLSYG